MLPSLLIQSVQYFYHLLDCICTRNYRLIKVPDNILGSAQNANIIQ